MSRKCPFTGKKTRAGRSVARSGKAKYLGGVGRHINARTKRTFKANMQRVRAVSGGRIQKPTKRNYTPPEAPEADAE